MSAASDALASWARTGDGPRPIVDADAIAAAASARDAAQIAANAAEAARAPLHGRLARARERAEIVECEVTLTRFLSQRDKFGALLEDLRGSMVCTVELSAELRAAADIGFELNREIGSGGAIGRAAAELSSAICAAVRHLDDTALRSAAAHHAAHAPAVAKWRAVIFEGENR